MTIQDIQTHIQAIIDKYPKTYVTVLQNTQRKLLNRMCENMSSVFNDDSFSVRVKVYYFMNNITEPKRCSICNNIIYRLKSIACSTKCAQRLPSVRAKIKQTNIKKTGVANGHGLAVRNHMRANSIKKHGVAHHTQSEEFQNKQKLNNIVKYGVEYTFQREDVKEKIKDTMLDKYGVENPFAADIVKRRISATMLDKYDVERPMQVKAFRDKAKSTCQARYGVDNVAQSAQAKKQAKQTCLEKYGVEYTGQTEIKKQRTIATNLERYGSTTFAASDMAAIRNRLKFYNRIITENSQVSVKFDETELDIKNMSTKILPWHCNTCNADFNAPVNYNWWRYHGHTAYARCPTCYPFIDTLVSVGETELFNYIKAICSDAIQSDRTVLAPQELDIYVPTKSIAFEFDGLYWHSDDIKPDKNYHLNKTKLCEEQGIHLIHIFENEWLYKQDIVKSRINLLLNTVQPIGARKCSIIELSSDEASEFLDTNHLQGATHAKVRLGLQYNGELVSVMTFSKPRFSKKYEWELVRFCSKLNYQIQGGASKLLKHFERLYNPTSLVSYADRRWSNSKNNVYTTLGFELSHASGPNYWYWKGDEFSSRVKYQKHKLSGIFENFDPNKTEAVNMYANGFKRIFDCGNLVFVRQYI